MNKLSKLKEQYAKLGEEIEALEKEFEPGWYACWYNNTSYYYVDFIPTNVSLSLRLSTWDNVVKIDKDAFDKLLKPKTTIYDWSKIPEWATIAVMNESGKVFCGDYETASIFTDGWEGHRRGCSGRGWESIEEDCILNPPNDWKNSFERRPE
jgi:hypothetical protein